MESPSVLLIDGDPDSITIYSTLLEHHGYRVLRALDGNDGVRQAAELQPQLIVLEPFTPCRCEGGGGILEALLQDSGTATIPLIVLTAVPSLIGASHSNVPPDRLFTKPMQPHRLLKVIERLLDQPDPRTAL
jgi:CheY-like chemotaxis protein